MDAYHREQMQSMVEEVAASINNLYQGSNDYSDLTNKIVQSAGLVDKRFVKDDTLITPWNSATNASTITIAPSDNDSSQFTISLSGLPVKDCTKLGSTFLQNDGVSVSANGTSTTTGGALAQACATSPATLALTFS